MKVILFSVDFTTVSLLFLYIFYTIHSLFSKYHKNIMKSQKLLAKSNHTEFDRYLSCKRRLDANNRKPVKGVLSDMCCGATLFLDFLGMKTSIGTWKTVYSHKCFVNCFYRRSQYQNTVRANGGKLRGRCRNLLS